MELFAADGHDAGGCERVTGKSGMRPVGFALVRVEGRRREHGFRTGAPADPLAGRLRPLENAVFGPRGGRPTRGRAGERELRPPGGIPARTLDRQRGRDRLPRSLDVVDQYDRRRELEFEPLSGFPGCTSPLDVSRKPRAELVVPFHSYDCDGNSHIEGVQDGGRSAGERDGGSHGPTSPWRPLESAPPPPARKWRPFGPGAGGSGPRRAWLEGSSDRGPHVAMRPRGVPGGPKASPRSAPARASARAAATGSGRGTARGQLGIGRTHSPKSGKPLRSPSAFSRFRWGQGNGRRGPEARGNRRRPPDPALVAAGAHRTPAARRGAAVVQRAHRGRRGRRSRSGPEARSGRGDAQAGRLLSWCCSADHRGPPPSLMARRPREGAPRSFLGPIAARRQDHGARTAPRSWPRLGRAPGWTLVMPALTCVIRIGVDLIPRTPIPMLAPGWCAHQHDDRENREARRGGTSPPPTAFTRNHEVRSGAGRALPAGSRGGPAHCGGCLLPGTDRVDAHRPHVVALRRETA